MFKTTRELNFNDRLYQEGEEIVNPTRRMIEAGSVVEVKETVELLVEDSDPVTVTVTGDIEDSAPEDVEDE